MRETGRCAQLRGSPQRDVAYSGRPWRVRNRGFCRGPLARSLVGIYFFTHGKWTSNGGLGSSWESSRKHGREFPTLRRSVWLVWRAFRAVS